jgi:hypothetical protein
MNADRYRGNPYAGATSTARLRADINAHGKLIKKQRRMRGDLQNRSVVVGPSEYGRIWVGIIASIRHAVDSRSIRENHGSRPSWANPVVREASGRSTEARQELQFAT